MNTLKSQSQTLADSLRTQIESGILPPGASLPSIRELAATGGFGRQVVLSAFRLLADEGLLRSEVGRGTRVNPELAARQKCRIAYVIAGDNLRNNFYNALFTGLCLAAAGSGKEIIPYEDVSTVELEKITADCILLTGLVSRRAVRNLEERGQRCIVVGNYLPGYWRNNIRFAVTPLVRELLMGDLRHEKSVGILTDSPAYGISREMIAEAERYSQEFDLPWGPNSVIAVHTPHGIEDIGRIWGDFSQRPQRIVTTKHLFLGIAQYLIEQNVPASECPELLVILNDESDLPLPFPRFSVRHVMSRDALCGPDLLQCAIDYITGRRKDGILGEYDPIYKKLKLSTCNCD